MQDENNVTFIRAHSDDVASLAGMNYRLIQDEVHRNSMSLEELQDRMSEWLQGAYTAILFQLKAQTIRRAIGSILIGFVLLTGLKHRCIMTI